MSDGWHVAAMATDLDDSDDVGSLVRWLRLHAPRAAAAGGGGRDDGDDPPAMRPANDNEPLRRSRRRGRVKATAGPRRGDRYYR